MLRIPFLRNLTVKSASVQWSGLRYASTERLFDKILVANRGEITCRVIRTCKRLGINTVAVYSEADAHAVHTNMADEAVCVGPAPSAQSYLNIDSIMHAIEKTGAQAVHPGYGFLSENHHFQEQLTSAGIKFIGPGTRAITAMGDKIESKKIANAAKVNTIPGFLGVVESDEDVMRISREIGYPVMIKASAGGGGKGMRVAWDDEEAKMGFRLSKEEAKSSFGDDRIFIEKYIEEPRHIEIQVLADSHGNVVALPERECSIQRRNQKVLEESPSVLLDADTRAAMQQQAVQLSKAVDYESAGTVEFLCDKHKNFYFLEMNTRLQVEHPVTEFVTGVDLVEEMIRVAAGHKLPDELLQGVPFKGWALESRVYAEDPLRGFLPSTGVLRRYVEPKSDNPNVRCDSGVTQGSEISMFYDPMICKLITYGQDREESLVTMRQALDEYVIRGVAHNVPFLRAIIDHPRFIDGRLTTNFIQEEYPEGFSGVEMTDRRAARFAAASAIMHTVQEDVNTTVDGRCANAPWPEVDDLRVRVNDRLYAASVGFSENGHWRVDLFDVPDGQIDPPKNAQPVESVELSAAEWDVQDPLFNGEEADGTRMTVQHLERLREGFQLQYEGAIAKVVVRSRRQEELSRHMLEKPEIDYSKILVSPMPGTLVSIAVEEGDHVELGQELAVVEAMKMQNVLRSERSGVIGSVPTKPGQTLKVDQVILKFADNE